MKHLVVVSACFIDTIMTVPYFPAEDEKLRAGTLLRRRGGNGPNTLETLQQLLHSDGDPAVKLSLCSVLPSEESPAINVIRESLGPEIDLSSCIYRQGQSEAASCYIIRSEATGSRTIVNYNELSEMTAEDFRGVLDALKDEHDLFFHFEGRSGDVLLDGLEYIRRRWPNAKISVELEIPKRRGLEELAARADVVFHSKSWAVENGYEDASECLRDQSRHATRASMLICTWGSDGAAGYDRALNALRHEPAHIVANAELVDSVGAGDTFIGGMLFCILQRPMWPLEKSLRFANKVAGLKVIQEGFKGLGEAMASEIS